MICVEINTIKKQKFMPTSLYSIIQTGYGECARGHYND